MENQIGVGANISDAQIASQIKVLNKDFKRFNSANLEDRQSVNYQLINLAGQPLAMEELSDVLNQTYKVATDKLSSGLYIFRLQIAGQFYAKKVFVDN